MKYVFLGDIHFRDDKEYFRATSEEFLNWYKDWELNTEENYLFLLGDLVESALLTGTVADFLEKFAVYSKFKEVHICVGNHDIRKFNDENQLAYEFYRNKENFHVYDEISKVEVEGKKFLMLPYFKGTNFYGYTMSDYYGNLYKDEVYKEHFDAVLGHFNEESIIFGSSSDCVRNLEKLDSDRIILGHIHTRYIRPDIYIGSVFAGKKSENDRKRCALVLEGNSWSEYSLPTFNEFISVVYPEPLPKSDAKVPIYTILNCSSESVARSKYGRIHIRKTTLDLVDSMARRKVGNMDRQIESIKNMNLMDLFNMFVTSQNPPLDTEVVEECKTLLENRRVS